MRDEERTVGECLWLDEMTAWYSNADEAWHAAERSAKKVGLFIGCILIAVGVALVGAGYAIGRGW